MEKVRAATSTDLFPNLQDPHAEFVLLRSCLALPKISFNLRTVNTMEHVEILRDFDSITREALSRILGTPVDDGVWQQAKLPVPMGGMELRGAEDHASAAYAASFLASQTLARELQHRLEEEPTTLPQELINGLSNRQGEEVNVEELEVMSQKAISTKIDLNNKRLFTNSIQESGVVREIARVACLGLPHAGDWLQAAPIPTLGLHLQPREFILAAKYRLGCAVYDNDGPCPACLKPSDKLGDHALNCGFTQERIARHNHLRDAYYETAVSAALAPVKEGRYLIPGSDRRPADVLIPYWRSGKDAALDITVVNPIQQATLHQAAVTPGYALTYAYEGKMNKAAEACRQQGLAFIPLAFESFGGWHEVTHMEVKKLAGALSRHTGQDEQQAGQHICQRLALLLQKGNAAILGNRAPEPPNAVIDGVE